MFFTVKRNNRRFDGQDFYSFFHHKGKLLGNWIEFIEANYANARRQSQSRFETEKTVFTIEF